MWSKLAGLFPELLQFAGERANLSIGVEPLIYSARTFLTCILVAPTPLFGFDANVRCVQERLTAAGYDAGPIDGLLGGNTARAALAWRADAEAAELPDLAQVTASVWCEDPTLADAGRGSSADKGEHAFWTEPDNINTCPGGSVMARMDFETIIYGQDWSRRETLVATRFIDAVGTNIGRAMSNEGFDDAKFAAAYLEAARQGAFTEPDFEEPGGPSPVFASSLLIISAAYALDFFDARALFSVADRATVINWVRQLDRTQNIKRQYASPDSIAAIAAARMSFGVAAGLGEMFTQGRRDFEEVMRLLGNDHRFERNARDNNEVVSMVTLAAEAAMRTGDNLYADRHNGSTLHLAIGAHARRTLDAGNIRITEGDTGHTGSYFAPSGFAAHVAWIPIYLHRFADTPAAAAVRQLRDEVIALREGRFRGTSLGGPTGCLWG